ncbi:MAG: site-2 protease family protein [Clostridia bacterium]|nr:site-2 protease family protein [Clostridia bacterium]
MDFIIDFIKIVFILGFLIFIHEGGHFIAARLCKVKVEEFAIGFGPKLWEKKGKETKYILAAIPFGGFLKMYGEEGKDSGEGAFNSKTVLQRFFIVAAGATVNVIFGLLLYFILSFSTGYNMSTNVSVILPEADVSLSSNVEVGDKIIQVGERKIRIKNDLTKALEDCNGEYIDVVVDRDGEIKTFSIKPVQYMDENYILGVQVAMAEDGTLQERLYYSFWETIAFIGDMFYNIKQLFTGKLGIDKLAGPIGISNVIAESNSWYDFTYLLAFISVSLGLTNFLPIPALDGGKMVLLAVEGIRRKPIDEKVEESIQSIGFLLLIGLAIFVSINDLIRLVKTLI